LTAARPRTAARSLSFPGWSPRTSTAAARRPRYDFALGSYQRLAGEYYRPVRKGERRFVAARASVDQGNQDYFETGARLAQYRLQRVGLGLDTGITFLRSEIRASYEIAYLNAAVVVGNPDLPEQRGTEQSAVLRYAFDSQDSATIPSRGLRVQARTGYFFSSPARTAAFRRRRCSRRCLSR
jgi:NTE family protein